MVDGSAIVGTGCAGFVAKERLRQLHIVPLSISYEYDPCDYLKAAEFQLKRDIEGWKKSKQDDVLSMQTGIMGFKGAIHYHCAPAIDDYLEQIPADTPKGDIFKVVASHIDKCIHSNYRLYPNNLAALDILEGTSHGGYSESEKATFEQYIAKQLSKTVDMLNKLGITPDKPNNKITVMGNPSLGEVKTMIIGVRNISNAPKSGEVWVNEMRLKEFNNKGGWAAAGTLNMQLSDFATVNLAGKIMTDGFGGLEEGVAQRSTDDYKTYSLTANFELGKFFPDKAKVTIPLYYSITKEETSPRYNPLDTDMELDDALEAMGSKHERDSLKSIAVTRSTTTNFSLSNVRVGIKTKRHPMPYDPANFSFSYSHSHRFTSGETTVWETDDQWRGAFNYTYSPVYKTYEPFKKLKGKSKWNNFPKALGLNYLPQNISFNTEIMRNYYELQERDLSNAIDSKLPLTFSEQFLWNREFSIRWDLTKNLHMNFQSATHAIAEEVHHAIETSFPMVKHCMVHVNPD